MGTYDITISTTATEIVSVIPDNLKSATDTALGLCDDIKKEAKAISAMSQQQAEDYLQKKFNKRADKFIDWIADKLNIELERSLEGDSWFSPIDEIIESEDTNRLKRAIADFKKVKNDGEKRGWKKFKELLKAVFGIIFAVFVEVAKLVLKLAFALTVGTIRVGCMAVSALLSCTDVLRE